MDIRGRIEAGNYKVSGVEYDIADGPYTDRDWAKYRARENELIDEFWQDVRSQYDHDFPPEVWEGVRTRAWEHGHSSGLASVLSWVEDLVELLDLFDRHYPIDEG